jgi:LacI family transcriptional regulator
MQRLFIMSVTQTQVAEYLGVSQRTVSNAFTQKAPISEETRRKVVDAAAKLGYRPNAAARAARTGTFGAIGILMSTNGRHSVLSEIIHGIQQATNELKLGIRFCAMPDEEMDDLHVQRLMHELCVDGVLVNYTHEFPMQLMDLLDRHRIPAIWTNVKLDRNCVRPDDYGVGAMAIDALTKLGHRNIGYVTYQIDEHSHYSRRDRRDGYCDAMRQAGLTPIAVDYEIGAPNAEREERLTAWLKATRPTAVFAESMVQANAVFSAARALGFCVPGDLSILAIHEQGRGETGANIDALRLPCKLVGYRAVQMAAERVANSQATFGCEAIPFFFEEPLHHSCGPCPSET